MADLLYTEARIFGGLPVDVTAQFAYGDDEPEATFVYWRGSKKQVSAKVYAKMTRDDWDAVDGAVMEQLRGS